MFDVFKNSWALFLGMLFLMIGNGLQGTLLGVRGEVEGFSTFEMSIIMSGYFLGFLGGSRLAPELIRRVGHVRVFAALASFISAVLILYPTLAHPVAWTLGRIAIGFCFSGVYVTAESWLNNAASNDNRGKSLSLYLIVQMAGVLMAQGLITLGDPAGYVLFIVSSVLVSISFAPILLSISPTPAFDTSKPMSLRDLINTSPLGSMGAFVLGGIYSAQFGMAAVYGTQIGLSVSQISLFVAVIYFGALITQYPIGWISDRMDRRRLILLISLLGGVAAFFGYWAGTDFYMICAAGFVVGATSNPLYSLILAYTNDYLDPDDMASASGGLLFINGVGAVFGPPITAAIMVTGGAQGFFLFMSILLIFLAFYAAYRMTRRAAPSVEDTASYAPILPSASPVAVEVASIVAGEMAEEEEQEE